MAEKVYVDNQLLISLIEQRPVLWDKSSELYKNRFATIEAWKEIAMVLDPDYETREETARHAFGKMIIQRWTYIRDNYFRSIKKIQDQKRAGILSNAKPYVYSNQLSFLQKLLKPNSSNKKNNATNENSYTDSENSSEDNDTVPKEPPPKRILLKRPLERFESDENDLEEKLMKFIDAHLSNKQKSTNRHLSFFKGILPTLDSLDDDEVLEFQAGVLQSLMKIKSRRQNPERSWSL